MTPKPLHALDPFLHPIEDLLHADSDYPARLYRFLAQAVESPFALSINGCWGGGKTTLMLDLQRRFKENGYPVLWFNPWEYEPVDDIVLCFLTRLQLLAKNKLGDAAKELGIFSLTLLTSGLDLAAQMLTRRALSFKNVAEIQEKVRQSMEGRYERDDPIEVLKKDFAHFTRVLGEKHANLPLIVFLDDLDRCLPEKALDLLEALKNLFVVPGASVLFISGIDSHVAKQFIVKRYEGMDPSFAYNYFKKIFNFTVELPPMTPARLHPLGRHRLKRLWRDLPEAELEKLRQTIEKTLSRTSIKSIRQYHNILNSAFFLYAMEPDWFLRKQSLILTLLALKETAPYFYESCRTFARLEPFKNMGALTAVDIHPEPLSNTASNLLENLATVFSDCSVDLFLRV